MHRDEGERIRVLVERLFEEIQFLFAKEPLGRALNRAIQTENLPVSKRNTAVKS
jgi:predicted HAD superfamily phosphohydrolase YqeG